MPIYEYRCTSCGFQQEHLQKMNDAPLTDCPECGKASYRKMMSAAGFHLKGAGWYATDFKHGSKPKSKSADKTATQSDDKPAPKSDDKAAAKSDDKSSPQAPAKKSDGPAATAKSAAGARPVSG